MTRLQRTRPEGPGPFRSCIGCRGIEKPSALVRFCLDKHEVVMVSRTGSGRGAWLCRDQPDSAIESVQGKAPGSALVVRPDCLARVNDKTIARALRTSAEGRLAQLLTALSVTDICADATVRPAK